MLDTAIRYGVKLYRVITNPKWRKAYRAVALSTRIIAETMGSTIVEDKLQNVTDIINKLNNDFTQEEKIGIAKELTLENHLIENIAVKVNDKGKFEICSKIAGFDLGITNGGVTFGKNF